MRVISGQARGLKLKTPEGLATRPTTDRIKESLFNIIAWDISEADFLDLFSGSGGIGIEALSRGASSAVFVDQSPESIAVINDNLTRARLEDRAEVIRGNALSVISSLANRGKSFDIIYMDPPYSKGLAQAALEAVYAVRLLKPEGFIAVEQANTEPLPETEGFTVSRIKDYGRTTRITFLRYTEENK